MYANSILMWLLWLMWKQRQLVLGTKEGVRQRQRGHVVESVIVENVGIDVEEDRHVHFLVRRQALLFKAEAVNCSLSNGTK